MSFSFCLQIWNIILKSLLIRNHKFNVYVNSYIENTLTSLISSSSRALSTGMDDHISPYLVIFNSIYQVLRCHLSIIKGCQRSLIVVLDPQICSVVTTCTSFLSSYNLSQKWLLPLSDKDIMSMKKRLAAMHKLCSTIEDSMCVWVAFSNVSRGSGLFSLLFSIFNCWGMFYVHIGSPGLSLYQYKRRRRLE